MTMSMYSMQNDLSFSNYSQKAENMLDEITTYANSITKLRAEVQRLESVRSLAVVHLNQYKQDYELLHTAYKSALDWIQRNSSRKKSVFLGQQTVMQVPPNDIFSAQASAPTSIIHESPKRSDKNGRQKIKQALDLTSVQQLAPTIQRENIDFQIVKKNPSVNMKCELKACFNTKRTITGLDMTKDNRYIAFSDGNSLDIIDTFLDYHVESFNFPRDDSDEGSARTVKFSPDGNYVASSFHGNNICVFKMPTGEIVKTFKKHTKDVSSIIFTRDKKMMISAGQDGNINAWSYPDFQLITSVTHQAEDGVMVISGIAEYADGKSLIVTYINGSIAIVDLPSLQVRTRQQTDSSLILGVGVSGFDNMIATCSNPNVVLWSMNDGMKLANQLIGHSDMVLCISFSNKDTIVVTGSKDEKIIVWNYSLPQPELFEIITGNNTLFDICHSAISNQFVTCTAGGFVCLWEYGMQ